MCNEVAQQCNLEPGQNIGNRYRVDKLLGEGSFGRVYKVHDSGRNCYAFKLLKLWEIPPDVRESLVARFKMEYETGQIDSEYLVHSLDYGMMSGNPFIVMEFCNSGDVISYSKHYKVNMPKLACHVLYGLNALHTNAKVHRDLKPENVLITPVRYKKFSLNSKKINQHRKINIS